MRRKPFTKKSSQVKSPICDVCQNNIKSRQYLTCSKCNKSYDLECGRVSLSRYDLMSPTKKTKWECVACLEAKGKHRTLHNKAIPVTHTPTPKYRIPPYSPPTTRLASQNNTKNSTESNTQEFSQSTSRSMQVNTKLPAPKTATCASRIPPISSPKAKNVQRTLQANIRLNKEVNTTHKSVALTSPETNHSQAIPAGAGYKTAGIINTDIQDCTTLQQLTTDCKLDNILTLLNEALSGILELTKKYDTLQSNIDAICKYHERHADEQVLLKLTIENNTTNLKDIEMQNLFLGSQIQTLTNQKLTTLECLITKENKQNTESNDGASDTIDLLQLSPLTPPYIQTNPPIAKNPMNSVQTQKRRLFELNNNVPSHVIKAHSANLVSKEFHSKQKAQNQPPSKTAPTLEDDDNHFDVPWQVVKHKRSRQGVIKGTGQQKEQLQTVERSKKIHVCFLKPETTAEAVKRHLEDICVGNYQVDKLKLKHERYASFVLTVPDKSAPLFMSPSSWPAGAEICEWFQRGAGRTTHRRPYTPGENTRKGGINPTNN